MRKSTLPFLVLILIFLKNTQAQVPDSLAHYTLLELDSICDVLIKKTAYQALLPYAAAATTIAKEKHGAEDTIYADRLKYLATAYDYGMEDYDKAIAYYEIVKKIYLKYPTKKIAYASNLYKIADIYAYNLGEYKKAEVLYKEGGLIYKAAASKEPITYAVSLNSWSGYYYYTGDYTTALELCLESKSIFEKEQQDDSEKYLSLLTTLGVYYSEIGAYEKAEENYVKALRGIEKLKGKKSLAYAYSAKSLAGLYIEKGGYAEAINLLSEVSLIYEKEYGLNHSKYIKNIKTIGNIHRHLGDYNKAEKILLKALGTVNKKTPDYAHILNATALLYMKKEQYSKAEDLLLKARTEYKTMIGEEHTNYAVTLTNLANLYASMSLWVEAEQYNLEALDICKKKLGEEHPSYGIMLGGLADVYMMKKDYGKANLMYQNELMIEENAFGQEHPRYILTLIEIASSYLAMKEYDLALKKYKKALELSNKIYDKNNINSVDIRIQLGGVYLKKKDYKAATNYYLQALSILQKESGQREESYIFILCELASLELTQKDTLKAWQYCQKALLINSADSTLIIKKENFQLDSFRAKKFISTDYAIVTFKTIFQLLESKDDKLLVTDFVLELLRKKEKEYASTANKKKYLVQTEEWLSIKLSLLDREANRSEIFELIEWNKSVLLLDMLTNDKAYTFGGIPDSLKEQEKGLYKEKEKWAALLLKEYSLEEKKKIRTELNDINIQLTAFQKTIKNTYPKYNKLKYQNNLVDLTTVQKELKKGTALIEYLVRDTVVYIFYIEEQKTKIFELAITKQEFKQKSKKLHYVLSNYQLIIKDSKTAYENYTRNAFWFYRNLIEPLNIDNSKIKELIIIPDQELTHLPFECFLTSAAPQEETAYQALKYLIKDYKISYNYSASLWKETNNSAAKSTVKNEILGISADYLNLPDSTKLLHRLPASNRLRKLLNPLPQAEEEVKSLSLLFEGYFAFGQSATEQMFQQKAKDYGVIHLAMHGILDSENPVLSSLAFTEDGDTLQDNFLQAYEISKMELNANLVVLSACETGYGRIEMGNGVASLARSFMYAGAPSLVVSLWQVNDMATAILMEDFYHNLANRMDKAAALQKAKLDYLQKAKGIAAHPAFWSAFVQLGATEAIELDKKGIAWYYWWALGGLVVLVGIVLFKNKGKVKKRAELKLKIEERDSLVV